MGVAEASLRVTHIGGPTVLLEVAGWTILSDPTFDPPGRRYPFALGTSSTKLVGPAIEPDSLPAVDVVVLSHDHHADNLDDGIAIIPAQGTGHGVGRLEPRDRHGHVGEMEDRKDGKDEPGGSLHPQQHAIGKGGERRRHQDELRSIHTSGRLPSTP